MRFLCCKSYKVMEIKALEDVSHLRGGGGGGRPGWSHRRVRRKRWVAAARTFFNFPPFEVRPSCSDGLGVQFIFSLSNES